MKLYYLDKLGWPVEVIKGRRILNFFRRLIHTRMITIKQPSCLGRGERDGKRSEKSNQYQIDGERY